jgi:hypothetical protein
MNKWGISTLLLAALLSAPLPVLAGGDLPTQFLNRGSINFTRHNLTQRQPGVARPIADRMTDYRNDYAEVCVYCHTPHAANTTIAAPLWNRTYSLPTGGYKTYDQLGTNSLTPGSVSAPGVNSLTCLSCHDGRVAVDSIINMPGPGRGKISQETTVDKAFLSNTWPQPGGLGPDVQGHQSLTECMTCHAPTGSTAAATDFSMFLIGTDLTNDHPIGVTFPTTSPEFNQPNATHGTSRFFDNDGNSRMGPAEVRTYSSKVECASCHDPHGVPKGVAPGLEGNRASDQFNRSFLRVQNDNSALCMTCHIK